MAKKLRELGVSERQKIRNFSTTLEYQTRKVGKKNLFFRGSKKLCKKT